MADTEKTAVDKLDVDNYRSWSSRMRYLLVTKGLWKSVEAGAADNDEKDQKALAVIGLHVKDHHLPTLAECKTAKAAWDALAAVYTAKSNARRLQLKRELNTLKKGASEPVTKYVGRAKDIRDQLAAAGYTIKDDEVALSLLAGLPSQYDIVATVLGTSDAAIGLDELLGKLLTVEQRTATATAVEDKAYLTADSSRPGDSRRKQQPAGARGSQEQRECYYCGKRGHLRKDCRKKQRDDKTNERQRGSSHNNVAMTAVATSGRSGWVLDSGASRHITNRVDNLLEAKPLDDDIVITFGNGETAKAEACGDVELSGLRGSDVSTVTLKDVLYVPGAAANLLSIPRAVDNGVTFNFGYNHCKVQKGPLHIATARFSGGIYELQCQPAAETALLAKQTPELWHRRYGHLSYNSLAKLQQHDMVSGVSVAAADFTAAGAAVCGTCVKAKQHKDSRSS